MKHTFTFKRGTEEKNGTFDVVDFPGNCGYKIVTYIQSYGVRTALSLEEREFIADQIRHYLHNELTGYKKIVFTARVDPNHTFDTIDFIKCNELMIGSEVKGNHGTGSTVCAEYDLWDKRRRIKSVEKVVLEGATMTFRKNKFW